MKKYTNRFLAPTIMIVFMLFISGLVAQISSTKHNLSTSGTGAVKSTTESEICLFCHAPHNAARVPLWNKADTTVTYTLYTSTTMNATTGQPDGNSRLCLSCHDGTVALGSLKNRSSIISFGSYTYMPTGTTRLSTDLSDDHPVSFTYDAALATADGQLRQPNSLASGITLQSNKLQCTSCHDPHKNTTTDFLVLTSQASVLCVGCHSRTGWTSSTHYSSTRTWNSTNPNPWFHTPSTYNTVALNGCENCHNPHTAGWKKRLLNFSSTEEANCLVCHTGNVALSTKNIQTQLNKTYNHSVSSYLNVHDANEATLAATRHVECVDCHNPHQSNATTANAPNVNGFTKGVRGINASGTAVNPASYQYEICFRCHSSNGWISARTTRQIAQTNTRLEFATTNPSYHPVEAAGRNTQMRSLVSPWTTSSIMYCTDCHASDGTNVPAGPHGSSYVPILKKQYVTADPCTTTTTTALTQYAVCTDCHSYTNLFSTDGTTSGWRYHYLHVIDRYTPCNTCHDPHGVTSSTDGGYQNHAHLINFNTNVVTADGSGRLRFEDRGNHTGACYLTCHGFTHSPETY